VLKYARYASKVRIVGEKRCLNGGEKTDDQTDRSSLRRKSGRPGDAFGPRGVSRNNRYADHRQRCGRQSDHHGSDQLAIACDRLHTEQADGGGHERRRAVGLHRVERRRYVHPQYVGKATRLKRTEAEVKSGAPHGQVS